jgi:hypothetical protein
LQPVAFPRRVFSFEEQDMVANKISRSSVEYLSGIVSTAVITPHATNTFDATRGVLVGVGGDLAVRFAGDSSDRTITLAAGIHPISIIAVRITGTTATGLLAGY